METNIRKLGALVEKVAKGSDEQAQGISQIKQSVGEMDHVVRQNVDNSRELSDTSDELNTQAAQIECFVRELAALAGKKDRERTEKDILHFRHKQVLPASSWHKQIPEVSDVSPQYKQITEASSRLIDIEDHQSTIPSEPFIGLDDEDV